MAIDRRTFLKVGLAGAATTGILAVSSSGQAKTRTAQRKPLGGSSKQHVLVLGAGTAGLTAALSLKQQGHQVTVIEYQNRVGGRLWSLPLEGGQFTEAGAGHFSADMPLVLSLVKRYKLPLLTINDGSPRYLFNGKSADAFKLLDWPWALNQDEKRSTVASLLAHYLWESGIELNQVLAPNWPDPGTIVRLDNLTLAQILRTAGCSEAFLQLLQAHGGCPYGTTGALGALTSVAYQFNSKAYVRVRGGNDRITSAMAKELGHDIILNAPVVAIDHHGSQVVVTVKDGREFRGDKVVSTIPFSVMSEIKVTPQWSPAKQRMIQGMGWADAFKGVIQTKEPKWMRYGNFGWPMAASDRSWERVIDITGNEGGDYGNAFFYLYGKEIDAVKAKPSDQRTAWVLEQFRKDLPDLIGDVVTTRSVLWSEQPWVKAAFGGPPIGGGWMIREWSQPEGRIHFAGDFTTLKSGWVEGAIESGLRAAKAIDPAVQNL